MGDGSEDFLGGIVGDDVVLVEDVPMPIMVGGYGGFPVISGREPQAGLRSKAGGCMNSGPGEIEPDHGGEYEAAEQSEEPIVCR